MKIIRRNNCVISGQSDLEKLFTFKNMPIRVGCTDKPNDTDQFADMEFAIGKKSGFIQLTNLIPLEILYSESHGAGTVGRIWQKHHKAFAEFIKQFDPSSIIEIGGAHGTLGTEYAKTKNAKWTIVDPQPSPPENTNLNFVEAFFDENFNPNHKFDCIVHSHVFEHVYDPLKFINIISNLSSDGTNLAFSVPNMDVMLKKHYANTLMFEHTVFLTEPYIEYILGINNFEIQKKEYFLEDHSIFYWFKKKQSVTFEEPNFKELYKHNKSLFLKYVENIENTVNEIFNRLKGDKFFLYGAHIYSQILLSFGLDQCNIISILDNDDHKTGKRLFGHEYTVNKPSIIKNYDNPIVINKMGAYTQEISKQLHEINSKVKII